MSTGAGGLANEPRAFRAFTPSPIRGLTRLATPGILSAQQFAPISERKRACERTPTSGQSS